MVVQKIFGIDKDGLDNPRRDREFECDPTRETLETIRQKIADEMFHNDEPEKITLIKKGKDDEEEEIPLEKLNQTLSDILEEGDSLSFVVAPFARDLVKIKLLIEAEAIEWIAANSNSKEFKFLVGNSKDYKEFPLDAREREFTVVKKSWWRLPTKAKVAIGYKSGEGYLTSQFVVSNGDELKICLEADELKYMINNEKKVGETKFYKLEDGNAGKYIADVFWKLLPSSVGIANLATNIATNLA